MNKKLLLTGILTAGILFSGLTSFAVKIEEIPGLTSEQKAELAKISENYTKEYNALETSIMNYTDKLNRVKADKEKSAEQISLLTGAYERNLESLKSRKTLLENTTDAKYKELLTQEQYQILKSQDQTVQSSFDKFLQK